MSVFSTNEKSHLARNCFLDGNVGIARYDRVKYPLFEGFTEKLLSFFWRPEEVDLSKDSKDFKSLTEFEKHLFTSNLKRQILLDTVQGRAPSAAFAPICSLPELETFIQTWTWNETIHSRTYTHIIRNIYSDPAKVFDEMLDIPEILECAGDISKYYDALIDYKGDDIMEHKRLIWLALNAVNALEGVRFYVSFATSWNFAELKKMEGNAALIKLIARDENIHLGATQQLIKILPREDSDFAKIKNENSAEINKIWQDVVDQEKSWAKYVFKNGSLIGLNERLSCDFVEWRADRCMKAIGLQSLWKVSENPLPWTAAWIAGGNVQVAPQEVSVVSYANNQYRKNLRDDSFAGFKL